MSSFEDYDEFGNYIGADLDSDEEEEVPQETFTRQAAPLEGFDDEHMEAPEDNALMEIDGMLNLECGEFGSHLTWFLLEPTHNAVVLHEDKQYYPNASDVYGQDVETLVQEEDAQPLTEPIIAPVKVRKWVVEEKDLPETRFDKGCVSLISFTVYVTEMHLPSGFF